jgi:hypothetical protein
MDFTEASEACAGDPFSTLRFLCYSVFKLLSNGSLSHHHTAVRALAFKWQRIIWRCWQDRKPYEEKTCEAALRKANSPLVGLVDNIQLGKTPSKPPRKRINEKPLAGLPQR